MTNYYEPKFRNWEISNDYITVNDIPITDPIPKNKYNHWYRYDIPSPSSSSLRDINLFSSIYDLTFITKDIDIHLVVYR